MSINSTIENLIRQSNGKFMTVTFRKQDGSTRTLNGRIGVRYNGKRTEPRYDGTNQPYYLLWSPQERGYRRIKADEIIAVATGGLVVLNREQVAA